MLRLKRNQKGFAPLETVLIIVIIGLVAFVVWYVFNTKSNTTSTLGDAANTTQVAKTPSKTTPSTTKTSTATQVVTTKTSSSLGQYLADTSGKTLYTYGADTTGVSNCTGSCLTDWPVYKATATTNLQTNVTVITRSDGTKQYAYKGMPLYYFTGDSSAGQVTGDGVSGFHVAKP